MSKRKKRGDEHAPNGAYWPGGLDEAEYCRRCREPWPCSETIQPNHEAGADVPASTIYGGNMSEDMDFCYTCDKETAWNGERCTGCHREWGYETIIVDYLPCGCCECCGCNCGGAA